jgi:Arc/MetJ-type ribon-helix-helix transcriptional regulator
MRKTSVYLSDEDRARLARLAKARGRSQAEVMREALQALEREARPDRNFALAGIVSVPGISAREIPEEELLKGFGDDAHR